LPGETARGKLTGAGFPVVSMEELTNGNSSVEGVLNRFGSYAYLNSKPY